MCTLCLLGLPVALECDRKVLIAWQLSCLKFLKANIMPGHSKKMRVSDEEVYELLRENEYGDTSKGEYSSNS
jgi:hypothetical protein